MLSAVRHGPSGCFNSGIRVFSPYQRIYDRSNQAAMIGARACRDKHALGLSRWVDAGFRRRTCDNGRIQTDCSMISAPSISTIAAALLIAASSNNILKAIYAAVLGPLAAAGVIIAMIIGR
jgi:hypothetical protein